MKKYIYPFIFIVFFIGCANNPIRPKPYSSKEKKLEILLDTLKVDKNEAKDLAKKAVIHSNILAKKYDLVKPPLFQNFLVNIGLRKKGLCWQFAYDMLSFVKSQNYKSFDCYIGGANVGDYWSEHNVLVVTCKGCKFKNGVLLDPWRNSGDLYFSKIKNDKEYKWKQRGNLR
ncbi:MAG: hypothetical protein QM482_08975 [Sulfurospirillum sp.]